MKIARIRERTMTTANKPKLMLESPATKHSTSSGKTGSTNMAEERSYLSFDLIEPFVKRLLPDQPRNDAVSRKASHRKGGKGAQQDADEAIYAAEERAEQRAPRNDGDGARDGQDDDLQKLHGDEHDAHPDARPLQKSAEFLFIADDLDKARLDDDIEDDGGKQQNISARKQVFASTTFPLRAPTTPIRSRTRTTRLPPYRMSPLSHSFAATDGRNASKHRRPRARIPAIKSRMIWMCS